MGIREDIAAYTELFKDAMAVQQREGNVDPHFAAKYQQRVVEGDWSGLVDGIRTPQATATATPYGQQQGSFSSSRANGVAAPRVSTPKLATEKQLAFVTKLLAERETEHGARLQAEVNSGQLTSKKASELIDWLLKAPRKAEELTITRAGTLRNGVVTVQATAVEITEGFYELAGTAYKVQLNLAGTSLYGKKLVEGRWEYVPGVVGVLTRGNAVPLTEELAAKLGHLYGTCVICNRRLTDEESIAKGIGPVCASKQGW